MLVVVALGLVVTALAAPVAQAAPKFKQLSALGIRADKAVIQGRVVQVRIRARRTTQIRLAVVRSGKFQQSWDKATVKKGTRTLIRRLRRTPASFTNLKLRVTAARGMARARGFLKLTVLPVPSANKPPTAIALSTSSVAENQPAGTAVGTLSAIDPNPGDAPAFSLVGGTGSTDNGSFAIAGTTLRTLATLNFEAKSAYSIRVRVSDGKGGTFERQLTIAVTNVNEAPTDIALTGASIAENQPAATIVGVLSAPDPDALDVQTFALVPGAGDADNASFQIAGAMLRTSATFVFPTPPKSVRVRATDAGGLTTEKVFSITITKQNAAPTDIALASSTVAENQPVNTVVGVLSATDPDAGDTFTFGLVTGAGDADNASFSVSGGSLRASAVFDFETKSSYSVRVRVTDGGGLTFEEQLAVTVTNANDAPTDIALSSASVAENEPSGTAVGTLSSADQDAAATHTYALVAGAGSTDNASFQISGSALQTSASLNFEAGATRSIRVRTTDDGGLTLEEQLTITVTDANDAPVADDESFSGVQRAVGNTAFVGDDPTDGAPDPAGPQKTVTGDILAGDADEDGTGSLAVVAGTVATNDGASVTIEADGDFTFRPAAGASCSDHSDYFDYTISDQNSTKPPGTPATDVGRVTIEIQDCVWYVDASAGGGGNGTSGAPFNALAGVNGAGGAGDADAASQRIFLYDGTYAGGLPLETSQSLSGQRHGLVVPDGDAGNVTLEPAVPAGAPSTIAGGLVLSANNNIQGIDLGNVAGAALSGTSVGIAVMNSVTAGQIDNQTGQAVSISGGALNLVFSSVSSNGSAGAGISLSNVTGTFTASAGTLANAIGADVSLSGGSSSFTYGGTISDDTGPLVTVSGETGGTKDFNGAISDGNDGDGSGVSLTGNTGATIRFDGGLTLATGASTAFVASGGGTVAVTDPDGAASNTLTTTSATALNISSTSIHADDATFERISSNGAPSAVVLSATGSAGGLTVTGGGGVNSGGLIESSTGPGISLSAVGGGVALTRMSVTGGQNDGIRGSAVNGLTLDNASVTNNGDAVGEHGLDFGGAVGSAGLTGTVALTGATITGNAENNVFVSNDSGTLNASVTGGTIASNSQTIGNEGILALGTGTGSMTVNVQNVTFTDNRGDHIRMATDASTTVTQNLTVNNSTLTTTAGADPAVLGGGITFNPGGSAVTDVTITNNAIQQAFSSAITIDTPGSSVDPQPATIDATISANTIGTAGAVDSGSESGDGISLFSNGFGDVDALIENNAIRQYSNLAGIDILQNDGNGTLDATVRGNTISNPGTFATNGILVRSGLTGGTETGQTCVDIGHPSVVAQKNAVTGSGAGGGTDIRARQLSNTIVRLPGYGGAAGDDAAVVAYLQARNNPATTPSASATNTFGSGGSGFVGTASCTLP